jgi:hypothetical protein
MTMQQENAASTVFAEDIEEGNEVLIGREWLLVEDVTVNGATGMIWLHGKGGTYSTAYPPRAELKVIR